MSTKQGQSMGKNLWLDEVKQILDGIGSRGVIVIAVSPEMNLTCVSLLQPEEMVQVLKGVLKRHGQ